MEEGNIWYNLRRRADSKAEDCTQMVFLLGHAFHWATKYAAAPVEVADAYACWFLRQHGEAFLNQTLGTTGADSHEYQFKVWKEIH